MAHSEDHDGCCGMLRQHLEARRKNKKMPFLVLYGSETGNSKSIAEKVLEQAIARNFPAKMATLDEYESMGLLGEDPIFCAIVVSTTGNGDAPKGAEKMFRFVKKRTLPNTTIKAASFSVLALGDTNYDKFCFVGKTIDSRLPALGAKQLAPVVLADEVTGLDTVVEPWITKLWDLYSTVNNLQSPFVKAVATPGNVAQGMESLQLEEKAISEEKVGGVATANASDSRQGKGWSAPQSFLGFAQLFPDTCGKMEDVVNRTKRLGKAREAFPASKYAPTKTTFKPANVIRAEYLTKDFPGENRVVIKATLELPADMKWDIGDALGFECPNPEPLVKLLAQRLQLNLDTVVAATAESSYTIRDILLRGVNLAHSPDRGFLRTLSESCTDGLDRARMELLASAGGREEYEKLIELQRLNVYEVLQLFPSCRPTLDTFLGALGPDPPPPRYYSIANSPLAGNDTRNLVDICFSVTQTEVSTDRIVKGVCTNELELFCSSCSESSPKSVMAFVKPNPAFKLPPDETRPVIMIGPGTGVAPFIGFIQHRPAVAKCRLAELKAAAPVCGAWRGGLDFEDELEQAEDALVIPPHKARTPDIQAGPATLYFGCRRPTQDFLYEKELNEFTSNGVLSRLRVAFSRQEPKQYVQDLIVEDGAEVADQILNQSAYVFVCGDGTKMARDVQTAVIKVLSEHSESKDPEQAKAYLAEMQKRGRYVQDIW